MRRVSARRLALFAREMFTHSVTGDATLTPMAPTVRREGEVSNAQWIMYPGPITGALARVAALRSIDATPLLKIRDPSRGKPESLS